MIEALGVPHTEVELVLVNGESADFSRLLNEGDRVAVYPKFESLDVTPLLRVRDLPLRSTRFVADSHLGGLAHMLRMIGFDTLYDNHFSDDEIVRLALEQERIVLTRDRGLLKRRAITHGCYVHALRSEEQVQEIFNHLDLGRATRPFTRCLNCNAQLHPIEKTRICSLLPPGVREHYQRFSICDSCGRVFWEGSHWQRMRGLVDKLLAAPSI